MTRLFPWLALFLAASPAAAQELRITSVTFPQPTCINGPAGSFCDSGGAQTRQECFAPPTGCISVYDWAQAHQDATGVVGHGRIEPDPNGTRKEKRRSVLLEGLVHAGREEVDGQGNPYHPDGAFDGVSEVIAEVTVVPTGNQGTGTVEVKATLEFGIWAAAAGGGAAAASVGTFVITAPDGTQLVAGGQVSQGGTPIEGELSRTFMAKVGDVFTLHYVGQAASFTDQADVGEAKSHAFLGLKIGRRSRGI